MNAGTMTMISTTSSIISIGKKDLQEMIDDGEEIEVNCQFCGKHYRMTPDELKGLLARL